MKVSAYHSSNPSDPDVYHDHDNCPTGEQIPAHNRVPGTARIVDPIGIALLINRIGEGRARMTPVPNPCRATASTHARTPASAHTHPRRQWDQNRPGPLYSTFSTTIVPGGVRSIADARSTGSLSACNGTTVVATESAQSRNTVTGTTDNVSGAHAHVGDLKGIAHHGNSMCRERTSGGRCAP